MSTTFAAALAADVMVRAPKVHGPGLTVAELREAFADDHLHMLVLIDGGRLLGTLLRSHQERAALTRRMAEKERTDGRDMLAAQLERRAIDYEGDVQLVKGLLRNGEGERDMVDNRSRRSSLPHDDKR